MTGFGYLDARHEGPGQAAGVLAFAHRGGATHPDIAGLENTVHAFRHAHELGYAYLETDVHVTLDGVLLAFHDTVLDRVTDRTGSISATTYAEVQAALIGGRERVPTLAELVDAFPDARFNIDLKSGGAVAALAAFVEERGSARPGAGRLVLATTSAGVPPPHPGPGAHLGRAPRGGRLPARAQRPVSPTA